MKIILKRIRRKGEIMEGQLIIDGYRVCDTLENSCTSLKAGTYNIQLSTCCFRKRKMPLVAAEGSCWAPPCSLCKKPRYTCLNTVPRNICCPQLTCGNSIHNRHDDCILVGRRGALGLLLHSKDTFTTLYERLRKHYERQKEGTPPITLEISH